MSVDHSATVWNIAFAALKARYLDDPMAQAVTMTTVERNGVADRVTVGGACTPAILAELLEPAARPVIFCDCEGPSGWAPRMTW